MQQVCYAEKRRGWIPPLVAGGLKHLVPGYNDLPGLKLKCDYNIVIYLKLCY